jgi:preprotein translocase subunit SecG
MFSILVTLHVIVCLAMILIVLLQYGRGAEMGAAFGGSNQTVFGSTGAGTFLGKITTVAAVTFMVTSLTLAFLSSRRTTTSSIIQEEAQSVPLEAAPAGEAMPAQPLPATGEEPVPSR